MQWLNNRWFPTANNDIQNIVKSRHYSRYTIASPMARQEMNIPFVWKVLAAFSYRNRVRENNEDNESWRQRLFGEMSRLISSSVIHSNADTVGIASPNLQRSHVVRCDKTSLFYEFLISIVGLRSARLLRFAICEFLRPLTWADLPVTYLFNCTHLPDDLRWP